MGMTLHEGHRGRMRERFRLEGLDGFAPHEVLELLLFYSRARGNVNPLAHELLDAFGSLRGVLEASPQQLMAVPGVGEETATLISLIVPMFRQYQACLREERPWISSREEAKRYCVSLLAGMRTERFYVLCLSATNRVLGHRLVASGSLTEVPTYPRLVTETALNYNAHAVILCHNHPGGSCYPSPEDLDATLYIKLILGNLDIELLDHIIVAEDEAYSMVQNGDLDRSQLIARVKAAENIGRRPHKSKKEGKA